VIENDGVAFHLGVSDSCYSLRKIADYWRECPEYGGEKHESQKVKAVTWTWERSNLCWIAFLLSNIFKQKYFLWQ
jgi:hypothetical protein